MVSFQGMITSACFTAAYFARPIHMFIPFICLYYHFPTPILSIVFMFLVVLLVVIPPKPSNLVVATLLSPILDHFQYDEIVENNPVHIKESMKGEGKRYIFASQPHGLVPFCGIAHQIKHARLHMDEPLIKTAVASRECYVVHKERFSVETRRLALLTLRHVNLLKITKA